MEQVQIVGSAGVDSESAPAEDEAEESGAEEDARGAVQRPSRRPKRTRRRKLGRRTKEGRRMSGIRFGVEGGQAKEVGAGIGAIGQCPGGV